MSEILLSFIVPVYNVEKYLNECFDSIFDDAASGDEYEVIAVDDGSTDGSPEVLKGYEKHRNFHILTQENKGPGGARNSGLRAASGKYVHFTDGDDYLLPGALRQLLQWARESDCDIIEFDNQVTFETDNKAAWFSSAPNRTSSQGKGKDIFAQWYAARTFSCYIWLRLYKREFLTANALYFQPDIFREDEEWILRCFFSASDFCYRPLAIYNYRRRESSASSWRDDNKTCRDLIALADLLAEFRGDIGRDAGNAAYQAALGDFIAYRVEMAVNTLYKSTQIKMDDKAAIFSELAKRRPLLGLATGKKGRRMYGLTRFLPAFAALRLYKFL